MKDIGFLQVVQLVGLANEMARWETPVCKVLEKNFVGHQPRHRHHLPAGALHQHVRQAAEIGDLIGGHRQSLHALHKCHARTLAQQAELAFKQRFPDTVFGGAVVLPALVDSPVGAARRGLGR